MAKSFLKHRFSKNLSSRYSPKSQNLARWSKPVDRTVFTGKISHRWKHTWTTNDKRSHALFHFFSLSHSHRSWRSVVMILTTHAECWEAKKSRACQLTWARQSISGRVRRRIETKYPTVWESVVWEEAISRVSRFVTPTKQSEWERGAFSAGSTATS